MYGNYREILCIKMKENSHSDMGRFGEHCVAAAVVECSNFLGLYLSSKHWPVTYLYKEKQHISRLMVMVMPVKILPQDYCTPN